MIVKQNWRDLPSTQLPKAVAQEMMAQPRGADGVTGSGHGFGTLREEASMDDLLYWIQKEPLFKRKPKMNFKNLPEKPEGKPGGAQKHQEPEIL